MTYKEAVDVLKARQGRKLQNNTYLQKRGENIAVLLHDTDVLTFRPNGDVVLNSGGWRTQTTSDRINKYIPEPWGVYSDRGTWLVSKGERWDNPVRVFEDGITLKANGEVKGGKPLDAMAKIEKEREKVRAYARAFVDTLFSGKMEAPTGGDCWDCYLKDKDGKTLGTFSGSNHIREHIRQKYYVPSLLVNALDAFPVSDYTRNAMAYFWGKQEEAKYYTTTTSARGEFRHSLTNYLYKSLGMVVNNRASYR